MISPWINSRIRCCMSSTLAGGVSYLTPSFWRSPEGNSPVLQDQARRRASWCPRNEKWVCMETLSWELRVNPWCVSEQLLQTSLCVTTVSMEVLPRGHAGLQISNTVRCFWLTWASCSPDLAVPVCLLYVESKVNGTRPANTGDLKWWICECIWGTPKNITFCDILSIANAVLYWKTCRSRTEKN